MSPKPVAPLFQLDKSHPFSSYTQHAHIHNLEGNRVQLPDDFVSPLAKAPVALPMPTPRKETKLPTRPSTPEANPAENEVVWATPPRQRPSAPGVTPPRPMRSPPTTPSKHHESRAMSIDVNAPDSRQGTPTHLKRQGRMLPPACDFGSLAYSFDQEVVGSSSSPSSSGWSLFSMDSDVSATSTLCDEAEVPAKGVEAKKGRGLFGGLFGPRVLSCFEVDEFTLEDHYAMIRELKDLGML